MLDKATSIMMAEEDAFKKAGIEYGDVTFICPVCGGTVHAARYKTPDCLAHKVGGHGSCEGCGYRWMA